MTGSPFDDNPVVVSAAELHGKHIGKQVRFMVMNDETVIDIVVEAELRQIYHVGGRTTVHVGEHAAKEQVLDPDTPVTINPHPPLSYVHGNMPLVRAK
jgi:hypothetical protein